MAFEDAVRKGDGQCLYEVYKIVLLIYKATKHTKFAYVILLYLTKICALLSEWEAERFKWNRFVNTHGGKGCNISLDLRKEHQNHFLKVMWRALGPNLNEANAAGIAGTVDQVESIMHRVDEDCKLSRRSSHQSVKSTEDAVQQIITDLLSISAFKHIEGREGHLSFPKFSSNLFAGLDYRDLHMWMKEKVQAWGSISKQPKNVNNK